MAVSITFDPAKRDRTLRERGLDFEQAAEVFAGRTIDIPDLRHDYGEARRPHGDRLLDAAWRRAPRHLNEEGQ